MLLSGSFVGRFKAAVLMLDNAPKANNIERPNPPKQPPLSPMLLWVIGFNQRFNLVFIIANR